MSPARTGARARKPKAIRTGCARDVFFALGIAAAVLLLIMLRDPHGRSFIYAVF